MEASDLNLNTAEQSGLNDFIKQCEVDRRNLKSTEEAFDACADRQVNVDPVPIIGAGIAGLVLGFGLRSLLKP